MADLAIIHELIGNRSACRQIYICNPSITSRIEYLFERNILAVAVISVLSYPQKRFFAVKKQQDKPADR
jgi:hypothetical protein